MNYNYADITSKIPEKPRWWDEEAVPRYCDFTPYETSHIYADEAALVLIKCQNCGEEFKVAFSMSAMKGMVHYGQEGVERAVINRLSGKFYASLADLIRSRKIHYGDPPNIECCASGPTMNCDDIQVLEYWKHEPGNFTWTRDHNLEIFLGEPEKH
jgi:hypothetical protein